MSHRLKVTDEQMEELEKIHREKENNHFKDLIEEILLKNNRTDYNGNIEYRELCNHKVVVDTKFEIEKIEFDANINFEGEDPRYVCTDCWTVWDYYNTKKIGEVISQEQKEEIKEVKNTINMS